MSTLDTMVAEIAADLRRSSMNNDIKLSIAAGLAFMRSQRCGINEKTFTFSTVAQQEYYTSTDDTDIPLIAVFDALTHIDGQQEIELVKKTTEWIDTHSYGSSYYATPEKFAYVRQSLRLFPVPVAAKTVRFDGILEVVDAGQSASYQRLLRTNALTVPGTYASAWFTDGMAYQALKAWAKGDLYTHKLKNATDGAAMYSAASDLIKTFKGQAQSQSGDDDMVEATQF